MMVNICRREASVTVGFFSEGYLGLWFVKSKKKGRALAASARRFAAGLRGPVLFLMNMEWMVMFPWRFYSGSFDRVLFIRGALSSGALSCRERPGEGFAQTSGLRKAQLSQRLA